MNPSFNLLRPECLSRFSFPALTGLLSAMLACGQPVFAEPTETMPEWTGSAPRLHEEKPKLVAGKGNFVVVPIPFSNPTLDTGLVLGAAYFHPQTDKEADKQPPSVSGAGALYSANGSYGAAIGHAHYWNEDRWRFQGVAGYVDLDLPLLTSQKAGPSLELDWLISGSFFSSEISRQLRDNWYLGFSARWLDIDQRFSVDLVTPDFEVGNELTSVGLGLSMSYDSRDLPTNAYSGRNFKLSMIANNSGLGGDVGYQSWNAAYRSYHRAGSRFVLAWEVAGCARSGDTPLWDACRIGLRGFPSTDYMGGKAWRAQAEGRWQFTSRWGAVAFAGAGGISDSLNASKENELIPSVGVGIRFMVQKANRINMRLDFARSSSSKAVLLSVMEAF